MKRVSLAQALAAVCPFCNAGPDQPCRGTMPGTRMPFHPERLENAARQAA